MPTKPREFDESESRGYKYIGIDFTSRIFYSIQIVERSVRLFDKFLLVMDNVAYHRSAATQAALSLFEHRVMVVWLPAYCSDLNLIERFWRQLKDLACANKLEAGLENLVTTVECSLKNQNDPVDPYRFQLSKDL